MPKGSKRKDRNRKNVQQQGFDWSNPAVLGGAMLGLFAVAVGLLLVFNGTLAGLWNSKPIDVPATDPNAGNPAALFGKPGTRSDDIPRISTGILAEKMNSGSNLIIVDVREEFDWKIGHIKGAINIPLGNLESHLSKLSQDAEIITYCACPAEETSAAMARTLKQRGFTNVRALKGGYEQWVQEKHPIEQQQ